MQILLRMLFSVPPPPPVNAIDSPDMQRITSRSLVTQGLTGSECEIGCKLKRGSHCAMPFHLSPCWTSLWTLPMLPCLRHWQHFRYLNEMYTLSCIKKLTRKLKQISCPSCKTPVQLPVTRPASLATYKKTDTLHFQVGKLSQENDAAQVLYKQSCKRHCYILLQDGNKTTIAEQGERSLS